MGFKDENNLETNSSQSQNATGSSDLNNTNIKVETVYVNSPKPKRTGISKIGYILTLIGAISMTMFFMYEFIFAFLLFFLISPIGILMTWLTWALGAAGNSKGWIVFGMITSFFGNPLGFFGYLFLLIGHKKSTNVPVSTVHVSSDNSNQRPVQAKQTNQSQVNYEQTGDTPTDQEVKDYNEAKESVKNGLITAKEATISFFAVIVSKIKSTNIDGKQKSLIIGIGIVALIIIVFGAMFVLKNFIGFTEVDLSDDIVLVYDTDNYTATPQIYANWNYYNENGYYDDQINYLVETGIYSEEEAEAFVPDYNAATANALSMVFQGYDLSTNEELSNGDTLEVTFGYDEQFAKQNKLKVINNVIDFEIKGLKEPITADQITADILAQMDYTSEDALSKVKEDIYRYDEEDGDNLEFLSSKVYFKADDNNSSSELVQVFEIEYSNKKGDIVPYVVENSADLINDETVSVDKSTLQNSYDRNMSGYMDMDETIDSYINQGYVEITF